MFFRLIEGIGSSKGSCLYTSSEFCRYADCSLEMLGSILLYLFSDIFLKGLLIPLNN